MKAKYEEFHRSLEAKSRTELIQVALTLFKEKEDALIRLKTFEESETDLMRQFHETKTRLEDAERERDELRKQNIHLAGIRKEREKDLFGRSTEKTEDVLSGLEHGIPDTDPLDEDADDGQEGGIGGGEKRRLFENGKKERKPKQVGKREKDLESLAKQEQYNFDVDELDRLFPDGWRVVYWKRSRSIIHVRSYDYLQVTYTPVVSVGLGHTMVSMPAPVPVIPKSLASPSLLASLFYDKYGLFLPYYRQEHDPERFGIPLPRQTMSNWEIHACEELLVKVYIYQGNLLKKRDHQQCDETTWLVIHDGRNAGTKSFLWTHRTSEMETNESIIHICYEMTRGSDHLKNFFAGITGKVHLTSDAYVAYYTLRDMMDGMIILCGCLMHARKRLVEAVDVMTIPKDMPLEERLELPEVKALLLIAEIYYAEKPLKELPAAERLICREKEVLPKVNNYFDYIRKIDINAPEVSEKLKNAIIYSLNHEEELRQFLYDGNVPIDDIATERAIRPIAQLRNNALFSCTPRGAKASVVIMSLIETARANGADPYYYLCFLLTVLPLHIGDKVETYMAEMMPWSKTYRDYEQNEKNRIANALLPPGGGEKPKVLSSRGKFRRVS